MIPTLYTILAAVAFAAEPTALENHLREHEGLRLEVYRDTTGHHTIGYGHRCPINQPPITQEEAELLLRLDIAEAKAAARRVIPDLDVHPAPVILAVESMTFQMGAKGLAGFAKFRAHLKARDYQKAANDMIDSRWAAQTPRRARTLAALVSKA